MWVDTHCHLDAPELQGMLAEVRALARTRGVGCCVLPAVQAGDFDRIRLLAHAHGDAYALGIHPLHVPQAGEDDLTQLEQALMQHRQDPRLVAVGEIGLDFFVPALNAPEMREKQIRFYRAQLALARRFELPVILHSRKSVDAVLQGVRAVRVAGGIAHAFNGSLQQAQHLLALGLCLGFGGALTFERARHLRTLAVELPDAAFVMETDAPDMPPQWLYVTAEQRAQGVAVPPNTPAELPQIARVLADLRGCTAADWARITSANAVRALPGLAVLDGLTGLNHRGPAGEEEVSP